MTKYIVKIDYSNKFEFDAWFKASNFIETALKTSTKEAPELEVFLVRTFEETPEVEAGEAEA